MNRYKYTLIDRTDGFVYAAGYRVEGEALVFYNEAGRGIFSLLQWRVAKVAMSIL